MIEQSEEKQNKRNWCERNLIIKDPQNNRLYIIWEIIFMCAWFVELALVPYT